MLVVNVFGLGANHAIYTKFIMQPNADGIMVLWNVPPPFKETIEGYNPSAI
jgi:hypothetical protein